MKKLKYTLIEILVSMAIFIIMMGILMQTFSTASDVASSEATKVNILTDANVFYSYLTKDFRGTIASPIPPPQYVDPTNLTTAGLKNRDPDKPTSDLEQYGLSVVVRATTANKIDSIEFYSDVSPYQGSMLTSLTSNPDYELLLKYSFDETNKKIYRNQHIINTGHSDFFDSNYDQLNAEVGKNASTGDGGDATILEGVEKFELKFWEDYEGGNEISVSVAANSFTELNVIPACITFYITMVNPSPTASSVILERGKRTISKTVYLN